MLLIIFWLAPQVWMQVSPGRKFREVDRAFEWLCIDDTTVQLAEVVGRGAFLGVGMSLWRMFGAYAIVWHFSLFFFVTFCFSSVFFFRLIFRFFSFFDIF